MRKELFFGMLLLSQVAHAKEVRSLQPSTRVSPAFREKLNSQLRKIDEHGRYGKVRASNGSIGLSGTLDGRDVARSVGARQGSTGKSASYSVTRERSTGDDRSIYRKVQPLDGHREGDAIESVEFVERERTRSSDPMTREVRKGFLLKQGQRVRSLSSAEMAQLGAGRRNPLFHRNVNVGEPADVAEKMGLALKSVAAPAGFNSKVRAQLSEIDKRTAGAVTAANTGSYQHLRLSGTSANSITSRTAVTSQGGTGPAAAYLTVREDINRTRAVFRKVQPFAHPEGDGLESAQLAEHAPGGGPAITDVRKAYILKGGQRVRPLSNEEMGKLSAADQKALVNSARNIGER